MLSYVVLFYSRSTTVYLADRRYDMLPAVLSSDLCSLISGVDRFVYPTHTDGIDYNGMGWDGDGLFAR